MARVKKSAQVLLAQYAALKGDRAQWDTLWDEVLMFIMPWHKRFMNMASRPEQTVTYDSTCSQALNTLASGMMSYLTPIGQAWFSFNPPPAMEKVDAAKDWFQKCSEILLLALAQSNFYNAIHQVYFSLCGPGTATLLTQPGKTTAFNFTSVDIGTYCAAEDDEGNVNRHYRELSWTAQQCEAKWGRENLSPELQVKLEQIDRTGVGSEVKYQILHAIYPRSQDEMEKGKKDKPNKAWASCYVEMATKHLLPEDGFDVQPFRTPRFAKWGDSVWGISPSIQILADIRQLDFLAMKMDALVDKQVDPPMLIPSDLAGQVDIRAGGQTYWDDPQRIPKEWASAGRYDIGMDREKSKRESIKEAYFNNLIQMFVQYDGPQITATQANEMASEKLAPFIPVFARMDSELLGPLLKQLFAMALKAGMFPTPPQEVIAVLPGTEPFIPEPQIQYSSRIALAIKQLALNAFSRTLERNMAIAQFMPSVNDNFDYDEAARDLARADGLPSNFFRSEEDVKAMREAQAQAAQQQQQMQMAMAGSEAVKNIGSVKPDSAIAQALPKAA